MTWIVLVDIRSNNGHVIGIEDDHGNLKQFATEVEAELAMRDHLLGGAYPCLAVDLDTGETHDL